MCVCVCVCVCVSACVRERACVCVVNLSFAPSPILEALISDNLGSHQLTSITHVKWT